MDLYTMFQAIKELAELAGPVGQETAVLDFVQAQWQTLGAITQRTRTGNVLGHVPKPGAPKLLLVAHADELCYLVRSITPDGFLMLANGQAWTRTTDLRNAFTIGARVKVLARGAIIPGVIGSATGHIASLTLRDLPELTWNDLWVDTGLSQAELLARGVTPGTRIIWDVETMQWGDRITGKALDDRVPLAVMGELLRRVPHDRFTWDLTLACTVQEEIGTIGAAALAAHALANNTRYDAAIILEIGLAGDVPTVGEGQMPLALGKGPGLIHKDGLIHYDYALTRALEECAAANSIAIQHAVLGSFGSDGRAFMQADIPSAMIVFPARYTHSPFEMGDLRDIARMVDWLAAFCTSQT
jgi:tetrahedral aminopeptidase